MSDMMRGGMPQGMPQQPQGGMDVSKKMSMLNPTDMAAKLTRGDIRPQQTVAEFLQRNFGVAPQDPVEKLFAAAKSQAQNATVPGKMGMPPGGAQPMQSQTPPPRSLDELTQRM